MTVRYQVLVAKGDQRAEGPDDAETTLTIPLAVATEPDFDATVEFMRGRLKVTGPTSSVFAVLASGEATATLVSLASRP